MRVVLDTKAMTGAYEKATFDTFKGKTIRAKGKVQKFKDQYEVVFTSGGVGPTHDDVTMAGVGWFYAINRECRATRRLFFCCHKVSERRA